MATHSSILAWYVFFRYSSVEHDTFFLLLYSNHPEERASFPLLTVPSTLFLALLIVGTIND